MIIEQTLKDFIKNYISNYQDKTFLVAFSGGYDSMCLLHCLSKVVDNKIVAIHLNHNWRGEESDKEEKRCFDFCKNHNIEFYSEKLQPDISKTETEARIARYKFFEKCAQKFCSDVIFTAHNKNDNVETLLYRISNGTGINGLKGIGRKRDIYYRPLLSVDRKIIENYCVKNELCPNFDSSNNDTIHKRNLIRLEVIPLLSKISPNIINNVNTLSQIAEEESEIIQEYLNLIKTNLLKDGKIATKDFLNLSESVQKRLLYDYISPLVPQNYDRERILTVWNFIKENKNSKSGKTISVTNDRWLFVSEKFLEFICKKEIHPVNIHITKEGIYEFGDVTVEILKYNDDMTKNCTQDAILVDLSGINFDFYLRNRSEGDFIQPFGLSGTQKLKKYLNARKIPNHEKGELLFLTQGKEVLWGVGLGISDKIRVKSIPTHKISVSTKN